MRILSALLALFLPIAAHAVVRVAPIRLAPVLSQAGVAGASVKMGFTLPSALPSVNGVMTQSVLPGFNVPTLKRKGFQRAAVLSQRVEKIRQGKKTRKSGTAAAAVLRKTFDSGRTSSQQPAAVSVRSYSPVARPNLLGPSRLAHSDRGTSRLDRFQTDAAGKAQPASVGAKIWKAVKILSALGFGLYGGVQIGDVAYGLALAKFGLLGLGGAALLVAGTAYFLRRKAAKNGKTPLFYSTLLGTFTFSAIGQLVWDATTLATVGLGVGTVLGIAAALYAAGVGRK